MWVSNAISEILPEVAESARADDVANIAGQTNGVKSPNLFSGFADAGLTVSTFGGVQFASRPAYKVILQTTYSALDAEISGYLRGNLLMLRVSAGGALYLGYYTGGNLLVGYFPSGVDLSGSLTLADLSAKGVTLGIIIPGSVSNWTNNASTDVWTFGAVGAEVYAKLNGVECFRKKLYHWMKPGVAAVWGGDTSSGTSNVTVKYTPSPLTYSNRVKGVYDIRDFGASEFHTTGSMTAGSPTLIVADASGISVGQTLIVETSGEAGLGLPGTMGVGGAWPRESYATTADIEAVTSTPVIAHCWDRSTGLVWIWDTNTSRFKLNATQTDGVVGITSADYVEWYSWKSAPRALVAKVIAKSGTTITLDTNAKASTSNTGVYVDCSLAFEYWTSGAYADPDVGGITLLIPPGRWAIGAEIKNGRLNKNHWTIRGRRGRKADTVVFAPRGAPNASIWSIYANYSSFMDFTVEGNHKPDPANENRPRYYQVPVYDDDYPTPQWAQTVGAHRSFGSVVKDCAFIDVLSHAIIFQDGYNCHASNCELTMNARIMAYTQWYFAMANGANCSYVRCTVPYSVGIIKAFETFAADGHQFIDCGGMNCMMSTNNSSNWLYDGFYSDLMPDSFSFWRSGFWGESVLGMSNFIYPDAITPGGVMRNFRVTEHGYANANQDTWRMMQVTHPSMKDVLIENGVLEGLPYAVINPSYKIPGAGFDASGGDLGYINSPTAVMRNVTIRGRTAGTQPVFVIQSGAAGCTVQNNTIDVLTLRGIPGVLSGNSKNAGGPTAYGPLNTAIPSIIGSPTVGSTLSVNTGTYLNSPGLTFTYSWQGTAGPAGVYTSTLLLTSSFIGQTVAVDVTATNTVSGEAVTTRSAFTAVVTA